MSSENNHSALIAGLMEIQDHPPVDTAEERADWLEAVCATARKHLNEDGSVEPVVVALGDCPDPDCRHNHCRMYVLRLGAFFRDDGTKNVVRPLVQHVLKKIGAHTCCFVTEAWTNHNHLPPGTDAESARKEAQKLYEENGHTLEGLEGTIEVVMVQYESIHDDTPRLRLFSIDRSGDTVACGGELESPTYESMEGRLCNFLPDYDIPEMLS